jgi:hypothetical protein
MMNEWSYTSVLMAAGMDFKYRHNPDGSVDSICLVCFATVATCAREDDLVKGERIHVCYMTKTFRDAAVTDTFVIGLP